MGPSQAVLSGAARWERSGLPPSLLPRSGPAQPRRASPRCRPPRVLAGPWAASRASCRPPPGCPLAAAAFAHCWPPEPVGSLLPGVAGGGPCRARPSLRLPRGPGRATRAPWLRPAREPPRHQRTAGCAPLLPRCLGVGVASRRVGASGTQTCSRAPRGSPSAPPTQLLLLWIRTLDTADGRVTGAPRVPRQPPVPGGRDAGQGARPGALRACGRAPPPEPPPLEAGVVPHTSATAAFLRSEREAPSGCCEAGVGSSGQGRGGTARHSARAQTPRRPSPQPCPAAGAPAPPCRRGTCLLTVGPFSPRPGGRRVHEGPAD